MVIVFAAQAAVTPAGKLTGAPIPVAPVVVCVMAVSAVLIHNVGEEDAALTVLVGISEDHTSAFPSPQPLVSRLLHLNIPEAVGVPLMVIVFAAFTAPQPPVSGMFFFNDTATTEIYTLSLHDALPISVTPAGKLTGAPIPVAPVVVCVMAVSAVLIHNVGEEDAALTVLVG